MRIVVSGAHYTGKSTLIEALMNKLPDYEFFEEPYLLLEEDGYEFTDPPTVEDYEEQLQFALTLIHDSPKKSVFDRCPLDFLAYGLALTELGEQDFDADSWLVPIGEAMESIDLIIFVSIEHPDVIRVPRSEDRDLRMSVDEKLREIVVDNSLGLLKKPVVLEVHGAVTTRVKDIMAYLQKREELVKA